MANFSQQSQVYARNSNLPSLFPDPIISQRAPVNDADRGLVGQVWVDQVAEDVYIAIAQRTWLNVGGGSGMFNTLTVTNTITSTNGDIISGGDITAATDITSTAGDIVATAGDLIATAGDVVATAGDVIATAGAVSAATTVTAGTGVTATTGGVTATAGDITATAGDVIVSAGDVTVTLGNITTDAAASTVSSDGFITGDIANAGAQTLTISNQRIDASGTATDQDVILSPQGDASIVVELPALSALAGLEINQNSVAVLIQSGNGAPGHAAPQGSMYLRDDGSSTSTRLYINTDGGTTWTNVVTAA